MVDHSRLAFLAQERTAHRALVAQYRAYEQGEQTARLNNDQLALFPEGKDPEHSVNVCPMIVATIADRIRIGSVSVSGRAALTEQINTWWRASQMDDVSSTLHYVAGRDGDAYLIVSFEEGRPRWTLNYQDDGAGGVDIAYDEGSNRPLYATKRWTMRAPDDPTEGWSRLNIYTPNRVEKYISQGMAAGYTDAGWRPYTGDAAHNPAADGEHPHIEWWTDDNTAGGRPLGLPVIHFPANATAQYGRSDLADVVPALQDQLNDASVDLRIATKFAGSKLRYVFGVDSDASTMALHPGGLMISADKEVTAGEFTESDLTQLIQAKDSIYRDISTVTGIPLANINPTAHIAAEGTLQQQEAPLLAKVAKRQDKWGNRYEDALKVALKAASAYGDLAMPFEAIEALNIVVGFRSPQVRSELADAQRARLWRENGIPQQIIWREVLGLSAELIAQIQGA